MNRRSTLLGGARSPAGVAGLAALAWLVGFGPPVAGRQVSPARLPIFVPRPAASGTAGPPREAADHLTMRMRPGESLSGALQRAGLDAAEAGRASAALADDFDTINPHPGLVLQLDLARTGAAAGRRLIDLSFLARDEARLDLWRDGAGALRLRLAETPVFTTPILVEGVVEGSLYLSLVGAGLDAEPAAKLANLFGRRLDLTRDVASGDRFRLVFEYRREADGRDIGPAVLLYAELASRTGLARLYRSAPEGDGPAQFVDGVAGARPVTLLRTPVDGARVTSGFGPRLHPILGFTRMHQGVDFAAPSGSPVLAAGDGVVEEARWSGGYGRWLKIRHPSGLETGYAHLSAWAPGIAPGAGVHQGQVVAFVGATGLATGPHLHFEVFRAGRRVDPRAAGAMAAAEVDPGALAFRALRAGIDATVASLAAQCPDGVRAAAPCAG